MFTNIYYTKLSNGLKVIILNRQVPTVTICLRGLAGSNYENKSEIGCAHLLEHIQTSDLFYKNQINKILNYGGRITGTTSRDDVAFLTKSMKLYHKDCLNYLLEIFLEKDYNERHINYIKNTVIREIIQNREDPKKYLTRLSYQNLYPKQRLSKFNTGDIEDVSKLTLSSIYSFKKDYYTPDNFVLVACGDVNPKIFIQYIKIFFEKNQLLANRKINKLKYKKSKGLKLLFITNNSINQLYIKIDFYGACTSDKNKYAFLLLSKILKIRMQKLMEDTKSIYNIPVYNFDINSFSSNTYGLFGIYLCIEPKYFLLFLHLLRKMLKNINQKKISNGEMNKIKNKIYCDIIYNLEKTSLASDFYSELFLYKQLTKSHIDELDNYLNCRNLDVQKAALYFYKQNPKITIIGNENVKIINKNLWV